MIVGYPEIGLCDVSEVALDPKVCSWYIVDGIEVLLLSKSFNIFPFEDKTIMPSHSVRSVSQPREGSKKEIIQFKSTGMQKDGLRRAEGREHLVVVQETHYDYNCEVQVQEAVGML